VKLPVSVASIAGETNQEKQASGKLCSGKEVVWMGLVLFCALSLATRTRGHVLSVLSFCRLLLLADVKFTFLPTGKSPWWFVSVCCIHHDEVKE